VAPGRTFRGLRTAEVVGVVGDVEGVTVHHATHRVEAPSASCVVSGFAFVMSGPCIVVIAGTLPAGSRHRFGRITQTRAGRSRRLVIAYAVRRRIHHTATASTAIESPTTMPDSMSWNGQKRLSGW
jgi:hypothetical protein